jgi:proline iminopeptidase
MMIAGMASLVSGQDGGTRAEFDCLMMANSSAIAIPHEPSKFPSYHHVWTPELQYGEFKSHGLNLTYEVQGDGAEVVIVVHGGAGLPHDYFHPMLSNLSRFARLVYFDRRGDMLAEGKSHQMASIDEMADDVDALRQALGLNRVTLLGHSFGGTIALNYALRHPEHVKRLILVSSAATVEDPREAEKRIVSTLTPAELAVYRSGEGSTGAAQPCERVRKRYGVLYPRYFYKMVPYDFDRGVYTVYFESLAKKIALASDSPGIDVQARLGEIKVPILVFEGRHDLVNTMEQAKRLVAGVPKGKLVVMEHSAHFPIFEENYLFTQWTRDFIAQTGTVDDDRLVPGPIVKTGNAGR